jgi:SagB-type dehydrogenase family enzyme
LDPTSQQEPRPRRLPRLQQTNKEIFSSYRRALSIPSGPPQKLFEEVLGTRRSRRHMCPPTQEQVATVLWYAARTRETGRGYFGLPWASRAAPSAGGLHPIDLIITRYPDDANGIYTYDPILHSLTRIIPDNDIDLGAFHGQVGEILPNANGCLFTMVANIGKTATVYENAESLVWRDAGCFLATLHLVAEWLDLAFCPLGILGVALVESIYGLEHRSAAGVCIVGQQLTCTDTL